MRQRGDIDDHNNGASVVAAAQRLSPAEQFEVIQALTRVLQQRYNRSDVVAVDTSPTILLPASVRRTPPVTSLAAFAADFWPEDETADDINNFIAPATRCRPNK